MNHSTQGLQTMARIKATGLMVALLSTTLFTISALQSCGIVKDYEVPTQMIITVMSQGETAAYPMAMQIVYVDNRRYITDKNGQVVIENYWSKWQYTTPTVLIKLKQGDRTVTMYQAYKPNQKNYFIIHGWDKNHPSLQINNDDGKEKKIH